MSRMSRCGRPKSTVWIATPIRPASQLKEGPGRSVMVDRTDRVGVRLANGHRLSEVLFRFIVGASGICCDLSPYRAKHDKRGKCSAEVKHDAGHAQIGDVTRRANIPL